MPIYEYQCSCCNLRFELKRGFNDRVRVVCPQCEGDTRLLFSPVPIVFKGPGFYVTDNTKSEKKNTEDQAQKEEKRDEKKAVV